MSRILVFAALTLGLSSVGTTSAEAGGRWYGRFGGHQVQHNSHWGGHAHRSHYAPSYSPWSYGPRWHDTSHLDYHGPSLQPHGNHFDYVPGHYDVHHSGHWDW
jgi:hypothetical protein